MTTRNLAATGSITGPLETGSPSWPQRLAHRLAFWRAATPPNEPLAALAVRGALAMPERLMGWTGHRCPSLSSGAFLAPPSCVPDDAQMAARFPSADRVDQDRVVARRDRPQRKRPPQAVPPAPPLERAA